MKKLSCVISLLSVFMVCAEQQPPALTVVIIIDQCSAHYLQKLRPYFTGGLKTLLDQGTIYTNAFLPNGTLSTAPGHAMIATGTYANYHGIINNSWYDTDLEKHTSDDDTVINAAVFNPSGGQYDYGRSARNMRIDTIADQLMLHSYPHAHNTVYALSFKSRAAIALAGSLGKAIWFDNDSSKFTTSLAYFKTLPSWLNEFNKSYSIPDKGTWKTVYPDNHPAYQYDLSHDYQFSADKPLAGKSLTNNETNKKAEYTVYERTPASNALLFSVAKKCLESALPTKPTDRTILFISLSSLDKVGHVYGPHSKEVLDTLYHIDQQLGSFMNFCSAKIAQERILFILTADHGTHPIIDQLNKQGISFAQRVSTERLINDLNELIHTKYNLSDKLVRTLENSQLYLDIDLLKNFPRRVRGKIVRDIVSYIKKQPGVRNAWTYEELSKSIFEPWNLDRYFKYQLYPERSGQIIICEQPYTEIDGHTNGTSHTSPYTSDTNVPLIFYQKGRFEAERIDRTVYLTQLAPTLASILNVPRPSATTASVLKEVAVRKQA